MLEVCEDSILKIKLPGVLFNVATSLNDGSSAVLIMFSNLLAIYDISQFKMMSVDPVYVVDFST